MEFAGGRRGGLTVFEIESTGGPGDRLFSASLSIERDQPSFVSRLDLASYCWRLDPN